MPATAGRVRMPANNRVHSSAALQTHGIWQSAIGYDPYAPDKVQRADDRGAPDPTAGGGAPPTDEQNAYDSFQGYKLYLATLFFQFMYFIPVCTEAFVLLWTVG